MFDMAKKCDRKIFQWLYSDYSRDKFSQKIFQSQKFFNHKNFFHQCLQIFSVQNDSSLQYPLGLLNWLTSMQSIKHLIALFDWMIDLRLEPFLFGFSSGIIQHINSICCPSQRIPTVLNLKGRPHAHENSNEGMSGCIRFANCIGWAIFCVLGIPTLNELGMTNTPHTHLIRCVQPQHFLMPISDWLKLEK